MHTWCYVRGFHAKTEAKVLTHETDMRLRCPRQRRDHGVGAKARPRDALICIRVLPSETLSHWHWGAEAEVTCLPPCLLTNSILGRTRWCYCVCSVKEKESKVIVQIKKMTGVLVMDVHRGVMVSIRHSNLAAESGICGKSRNVQTQTKAL